MDAMNGRRWLGAVVGILVGLILATGLFTGGVVVGSSMRQLPFQGPAPTVAPAASPLAPTSAPTATQPATMEPTAPPATSRETDALFAPFWQAWDIIHQEYVDPVRDLDLMRGAISGMMDALGDPHSSYMDPNEYEQASLSLSGEYEGIGAWVDTNTEYLTIISPMPDSPAMQAGLKSGDEILAIDGRDMTSIDGNQVIQYVLGPAGTKVHLTIRRQGVPQPLEFDVVRKAITVPSVHSEMLDGGIGYVQLFTFGDTTSNDLRQQLESLQAQNPKGLILDLRNNGGGYLDTSVQVASEFITDGPILSERFGDGSEHVYRAQAGGLATDIPLVVLVNQGTASASEIVAGAIQDTGRGTLVGTTTFGKGSVQNWIPLSGDGGAVRVTVARWYTPNGRQISGDGLTPDVSVDLTDQDVESGQDPQLDKALELLQSTSP
jgi:carboxyl-terminal processing protease